MKKYYISLLGLTFISLFGFTQNSISSKLSALETNAKLTKKLQPADPDFLKKNKFQQKAFLDTIGRNSGNTGAYFDFNGGPQGWTIVNNMANNFQWQWATTYQNGGITSANSIITSTTAANGFMSLPADFYNTPIPPLGAVSMNTYIESPSIDLTNNGANPNGFGSVWVTYQQTMAYCCSSGDSLLLQVSTDNFVTFTNFDATNNLGINAISGTFSNVINISSAAQNATSIKVRFLSNGNTHYFWMIDDFAVIEGPSFDMGLVDAFPEFNADSFAINPFYSQIPLDLFNPLYFSGTIFNNGSSNSVNSRLAVSVTNDSTRFSPNTPLVAGLGLQYFNSELATTTMLPNTAENLTVGFTSRFVPTVLGQFTIDFLATSSHLDQNIGNETDAFSFEISNVTMAKDDGGLAGELSSANFVRMGLPGGTSAGDELITMFIVEPNANAFSQTPIPTSISFLVSLDSANINAEIIPKLYPFDETQPTLDQAVGVEVASSFLPYTVQAADLGRWITLPFDNGSGFLNGITSGQYMAGWETISIAGGTNFSVQQDLSSGSRQPGLTTIIDFGHSPGWGNIAPTNPGIRLNFDSTSIPLVTSINPIAASNAEFTVSPNPNNGEFNIAVATNNSANYQLNIRNMLGQLTYSETISVNNQLTKQIDLKQLEKGVYFVSIENETEKLVKKVILK